MRMFTSLPSSLLISSLVLAVAARPVESAATELRELTASDFSSSTQHGVWFVEYFSPSCGHCRTFAPTWSRLVEHVDSQDNPGISLARVNCLAQGDLCNENNIKGYPSMKLYEDGKEIEDFNEDRDFDVLTKYVARHARKAQASTPASTSNPNGAVLPLDKNTFKNALAQGPAFVKFFAPWCGHCKKLAPTWVQFAGRMKEKVTVAEVNCEEHKALCSQEKIQGYPMIFFYQHGRTLEYTGRRTLDAMEAFADAALAPPLKSISPEQLTPILEDQDVLYLLIHEKLDPAVQDRIEEASQPLHGSPQILSIKSSPDLLSSLSLTATQKLPVLISLKDHSFAPFRTLAISRDIRVEEISEWLITHSLPTSTGLSAENFQRVMGPSPSAPGLQSRLVVLAAINPENLAHIDLVKEVARVWHRGAHANDDRQVVFAWMDKEKWASWLKSVYGLKKGSEPAVVIVDHGRLMYYDTSSQGAPIQLEASSIVSALEGVSSGVLRPKHSENIAERFARWLNEWMVGIQTSVSNHPWRSALLVIIMIFGVFLGLKRFLEEDSRKTPLYGNNKSGTRLD